MSELVLAALKAVHAQESLAWQANWGDLHMHLGRGRPARGVHVRWQGGVSSQHGKGEENSVNLILNANFLSRELHFRMPPGSDFDRALV